MNIKTVIVIPLFTLFVSLVHADDHRPPDGNAWPLVDTKVVTSNVVKHEIELPEAVIFTGIKVFYSPHIYTKMDYDNESDPKDIDKIMPENNVFIVGSDRNTMILNSHDFWTDNTIRQLKQYGTNTIIVIAGMTTSVCAEPRIRNAIEKSFDVTLATTPYAKKAPLTNYKFLTHEVAATNKTLKQLHQTKAM